LYTTNTKKLLGWLGLNDASEFDPNAVPTEHIDYELALKRRQRLNPASAAPANSIRLAITESAISL
jgi:hypothetical protein